MELSDKTVVVTGAASGIGRALAVRFAAEGARVVVADRDGEACATVGAEIGAVAVTTDVSSESSIQALIDRAKSEHGPIDLFFSNAGIGGAPGGPEVADSDWQQIWEINVMSHVWAARALVPEMVARGEGYLASTASAAGLLTQIGAAPYAVTKHAAVAFAEWLAVTYGDAGIKVSVLCPQGVQTPLVDRLVAEDPVGAAPLLAEGVITPEECAAATVEGLRHETLLILPHPQVSDHLAVKATQPDRWVRGMRRLLRAAQNSVAGS